MPARTTIRRATSKDLPAVAELRWRWLREIDGRPGVTRTEFGDHFVSWAEANAGSHHCLVLVRDERVVGMGWLAVLPRVPSPRSLVRASGDVQCVYVVPELRDSGLGGQLLDALAEFARKLGLERVTVHASTRSVPAYARHGFDLSPTLRQLVIPADEPS